MSQTLCAAHVQPQIQSVTLAILQDQVQLPSLPKLVNHIRTELSSPKSNAQSIGALIAQEPTLAATVIRFANSPLYGAAATVKTLPMAVQRLGLNLVSSLVLATASRQLFHASSPWTATQLNRVWSHSVRTAALSKVLAVRHGLDQDLALLSGLLHDIGSFVMLVHMENTPDLFVSQDRLDCLLYETRVEAGVALARHWNLPDEALTAIKEHNTVADTRESRPADILALVRAASWFLTEATLRGDTVERQRSNALARIGLPADADLLADPETVDQVDAIIQLLRG